MRLRRLLAFLLVSLSSLSWARLPIVPTTTLSAETGNNTSTADSFTGQSNGNIGATNISKLPVGSLLGPGATTRIYAHVMPWWGTTSHINIGYTSADVTQVRRQIADMKSRGIHGAILYWAGRPLTSQRANHDIVAHLYKQEAELAGFEFAVQHDKSALDACAATAGCDVTRALVDDLNYAAAEFYGSPAYMRRDGRPVVPFFGLELIPNINWDTVRAQAVGNPKFIQRNSVGYTFPQSNGAFAWIGTSTSTDPAGLSYLRNFYYRATVTYPLMETIGSVYPGFDDTLAAWGKNRIMPRRCGQTWLDTFDVIKQYYPLGNLESLQLNTWNDYEEGSEIESGIDNCVSVNAAVAESTLRWTLEGSPNTVAHLNVFISTDGENLMKLAELPVSASSLHLASFDLGPGNYTLYVQAYGKPMMTNKMSNAASFVIPNQLPVAVMTATPTSGLAPLTVTVNAAASTDADGSIVTTSIDFGDGTATSRVAASHTYTRPGTYDIVTTVIDDFGDSSTAAATVNVSNNAPVAMMTLSAESGLAPLPVTVNAAESSDSDGSIVATLIDFGDGTHASAGSATHSYARPGSYTITVTVTDDLGATGSASRQIRVQNNPPVAQLALSATSGYAGLSVIASSAGSIDSDGSIAATFIDFGNGTTANAPSATSAFTTPGTYIVTLTVTDDLGATATATETVTILNTAPVARLALSSTSGYAPVTVSVSSAASTDSDGSIVSRTINFGDGSASVSGTSATRTYTTPGTYTVTIEISDNNGASSTATETVTVLNNAPVANLSLSATSGYAPLSVTASNSGSSDVDGSIVARTINFGDGSASVSGTSATRTYTTPGTYTVTIEIMDNNGASSTATETVTVLNNAPVADLSLSATSGYAPLSVTASNSGSSDVDGSIVTRTINFGDGSATISGTSATRSYNTPGTYTVTTVVTDNNGATDTATTTVTVLNNPPVARLSLSAISGYAPLTVIATNATSTDTDGSIVSSTIDFGDGSVPVSGTSATRVYGTPGTYTVTTTVTDNNGASSTVTATINVLNNAPVARLTLSATSGYAPLTVTASNSDSTDADGTIASRTINFGDGSGAVSGSTASHTYSAPGTYTVTTTITDNNGATSTATAAVTVLNTPPVAKLTLSATTGYAPFTVTASNSASSDADGTIVARTINFGDGTATVSGTSATRAFNTPGTYTVTTTVTDNHGATSSATATVTVKVPRRVRIFTPADGASVGTYVHLTALGESEVPVTAGKIYLDNVAVVTQNSTSGSTSMTFDRYLSLKRGQRRITVQIWDTEGIVTKSTVNVTVK